MPDDKSKKDRKNQICIEKKEQINKRKEERKKN